MPGLQNGDDYRYHGTDDYSFVTRSDRSRDFARRRRFGNENDAQDPAMSQVSLPLRISRVGSSSRQGDSPYQDYYSPSRYMERRRSTSPQLDRSSRLSGAVRHALALCGELDEDDPYYRERTAINSPANYYEDDEDDEYVIVLQKRCKRPQSGRSFHEKDKRRSQSRTRPIGLNEEEGSRWMERRQRPHSRGYGENTKEVTYTMPVTRKRGEDEEDIRESASYLAARKQFAVEDNADIEKLKNKKYEYRTKGPNPYFPETAVESLDKGNFAQAPMFVIKPRSHTIWEKMYVKFTCTVRGTPEPKVTWYHNMIAIDPSTLVPGTMRISNQFGVHTLEIFQASLDNSGTYRASAQNHKGEISSYATLIVRRYDGSKTGYYDVKSGYNLTKPTDFPDVEQLDIPGYPRFLTKLYNKKVTEGDAVVLTCHIDGKPNPEVFWTLNGRNLDDKVNHIQETFEDGVASLSILHTYCDDEGEYVCRAYNSCGSATSKSFLSVNGVNAPPSAPTCLKCTGLNRHYLILNWKPPGYSGHFGGAPILGYLVEKAVAGSNIWTHANTKPIKLTTTPISSLNEGEAYFFRVRAFTRWGRGPPSLPIGPVAMRDRGASRHPLEMMEPGEILPPTSDDVENENAVCAPNTPQNVKATLTPLEDTVFVSWDTLDGAKPTRFVIEYCADNNEEWKRVTLHAVNTTGPYPVTDLSKGKTYRFRVFAVNAAGESQASVCSVPLLLGGIPDTSCYNDIEEQDEVILEQSDIKITSRQYPEEGGEHEAKKYRGPPTPPRDVQCLQAKREYIEIGWIPSEHSGGDQVEYLVEYRRLGSETWNLVNINPIRYTQFPVGELDEGDSYMFRVRSVNKYGASAYSEPSEPILASDGISPPNWWGGMQDLFKVAENRGKPSVTRNSIKVCWDLPTTDGGSNVLGYYLECRPCGGKFHPVNNKPINQRHFTVDGLNPGEFYEFRIRSCNEVGCGDWKMMPGRIQAKDPDRPSEPTDVVVTSLSDESVSLEWRKPNILGDGAMIGYIVERRKEEIDFWIPCNKLAEEIQDEKYTVSGLVPGQTYFFRVRAVNHVGEGQNSLQSCYVTMGEPLADVLDRQNAIFELKQKKKQLEVERKRLLEEEERKEAFLTNIEDCYATEGGQAKFECKVKDKRTKVLWFYGNWKEIELEPKGKFDIVASGRRRSLLVNNCGEGDVQAVHCVAQYNQCQCVADLMVDKMFPVRFIRFPVDVHLKHGERATIDCVLSKPSAEITWRKFDEIITAEDNDRYEFINQGCGRSLLIHDVNPDDIAMYTIEGLGGSCVVNLVVDGVLPVKFTKNISSETLPYTSQIATFECVAQPSPLFLDEIPPCQWYHNNELVEPEDDKYELISNGNTHTLKVLNPTFEDNGTILCVVGGGKTTCNIYVEKPPPPPPKTERTEDYIINFEQGLKAEALASAIRLYCIVSNLHEDAHIIWYKDDSEIDIDNNKYKSFNDNESGLVSLVVSPITDDLERSKFTCEFITPQSTFDTKVNYELNADEFKKLSKQACSLLEEEENERRIRKQEREKKKQERKKQMKESTVEEVSLSVPSGITFDVTEHGNFQLTAKATSLPPDCEIIWMKNSEKINGESLIQRHDGDKAVLIIENPSTEDAGTYTCQIKAENSNIEASSDFTGKVFKEMLLRSAEIRIQPLADCDQMIQGSVFHEGDNEMFDHQADRNLLEIVPESKDDFEESQQETCREETKKAMDESEAVEENNDQSVEETLTEYLNATITKHTSCN